MPLHHALVFVLLLLPGTSLRDWQAHAGPNLRYVMQHGAIGLMNARTAEKDTITEWGSIRSICAGARMAPKNDGALPYKADDQNLRLSLAGAGVELQGSPENQPMTRPPVPVIRPGKRILFCELGGGLGDADYYVGQCVRDHRYRLMIVSTNPSPAAYVAQDRLCPVLLYGDGIEHGLLMSPSTHTAGLVTNTDIAPTIAAYFGANLRTPAFGAPISGHAQQGDVVAKLASQNEGYIRQARVIRYLPYVAGAIAALVALFSWLIVVKNRRAEWLVLIVFAVPVVMMFTNFAMWELVLIANLPSVWFYRAREAVKQPVLIGWAIYVAIFVLLDVLLLSGRLFSGSMLGYTPSEGARYYGVGNEVMGFWIGAATYTCCKLVEHPRGKVAALVLALAVIMALGLPSAGAKAGGFLVGLITLAAALWTRSGRAVKPGVAIIGGVGVLAAGLVGLVVMGKLFGASHVTQTIGMAHSEGFGVIASVIDRKAVMDAHLVFHSVWMIVLLVTSAATFIALRPVWRSPNLPRTEVVALITATAASLLLNDAGVVAAALCSLTLWSSAMLIAERIRITRSGQLYEAT